VAPSPDVQVRIDAGPEDRAAERAAAREARAKGRADAMTLRLEASAAGRDAEIAAREQARLERRQQEMQSASGDPHAAAARRYRTSGRKDIVREQRDTRSYATLVDADRIGELARRGASLTGLAGAFGITPDEVQAILDAAG